MKHHFIDYYSEIESPIQRLDPRIKIIAAFFLLFAVVITPNGRFLDYLIISPVIILIILFSRLPLKLFLKRIAIITPLVALIGASMPFMTPGKTVFSIHFLIQLNATDSGISNFFSVIIKAVLAVIIMTLLTAATNFRDLIAGMQKLKFPVIFTSIISFIYRYIFLFVDEIERMNIGRRARSFGRRPALAMKGFGWMISSLFLRSFERADRVYHSMCARGFDGNYQTITEFSLKRSEIFFCVIFLIFITLIKLIGHYYG